MMIYARVVEAGSFSGAARELGLSKSAVSKQISRLEDRLGARLLNRTTRRLSMTEVGTNFYERVARIVSEAEQAEQAVTSEHAEPHGTLRINAPMSFGNLHIAPAIPSFMAQYPELNVSMNLNDRLVDLVEEGYDVAIRIARMPDSSLVARSLAPLRQVVCATPDYWKHHTSPLTPNDLKNHNCLIYTYQLNPGAWRFRGPKGPSSVNISGNFQANNGDTLRAVALGGQGLYLGPAFIVSDDLRAGRLQAVMQDFEETDLSIYAVYPHSRHLSAKVRAFVDFLAGHFSHLSWLDRA
jgi:DNA-binding transcriptional LysR family regulator